MNQETKYTSMSQEEKRKKLKEESESKRKDVKEVDETLLRNQHGNAVSERKKWW